MTLKFDDFRAFSRELSEAASEIILTLWNSPTLQVDTKADQSPVTQADRDAEGIMRQMIGKRYPSHGIIGEEFGIENEDAELRWTLDPIDGTISFVHGCPLFGILIGLMNKEQPLYGSLYLPVLGNFFCGDGKRTFHNGHQVYMRTSATLSEATLLTTDIGCITRRFGDEGFQRLHSRVRLLRTWGDCFGYSLLLQGKADVMIDPILYLWDLVPLSPLIKGAGGAISSWHGAPPLPSDDLSPCSAVATSVHLHSEVLELLR